MDDEERRRVAVNTRLSGALGALYSSEGGSESVRAQRTSPKVVSCAHFDRGVRDSARIEASEQQRAVQMQVRRTAALRLPSNSTVGRQEATKATVRRLEAMAARQLAARSLGAEADKLEDRQREQQRRRRRVGSATEAGRTVRAEFPTAAAAAVRLPQGRASPRRVRLYRPVAVEPGDFYQLEASLLERAIGREAAQRVLAQRDAGAPPSMQDRLQPRYQQQQQQQQHDGGRN
jgi:hypothetical protein